MGAPGSIEVDKRDLVKLDLPVEIVFVEVKHQIGVLDLEMVLRMQTMFVVRVRLRVLLPQIS